MTQIPPLENRTDSCRALREPEGPIEVIYEPFATFSEWTLDIDEKAYAGLKARRRKNESAFSKSRNR